jgi:transcriptional regulator with XRE-family HTH domain
MRGNPGVLRGVLLLGLRPIMTARGVRRVDLAKDAQVNYTTLWRLESGNHGASHTTALRIALALGVDVKVLESVPSE